MTINEPHRRTPHAMQPQTSAPQQQARAHGAMTALAGAPIGASPAIRQSAGAPVAMKMPR